MKLPLKERNAQLEKELAGKNRELEIEEALERVRAVAMAMRKSEELMNIAEVMYNELFSLGFSEIRNAIINIYNNTDSSFINYDYADEVGKSFNRFTNNILPFVGKMIKTSQSADDAFSETYISGKSLVEFKRLRKKTGQKDDPRLNSAKNLYFCFYSIGTGSIGISTFAEITEEKKSLLKRFRNVFNLSYQRYIDILLAEAQAKEARIETSLERVRAVAMAMKKSEEVINVCEIMYKELLALGFSNIRNAQIALKNDEKHSYLISVYSNSETVIMEEAPYNSSPIVKDLYDELGKSKDAFYQREFSGKKLESWRKWRGDLSALKDKREIVATSICFYLYSIGNGHLGISTFNAIPNDQVETLKRFKNVFELSYTRYIDVAKAEAQAKEAQIELALERVRARTMAMQKSDELLEASDTLFDELHKLNIETIRVGIGTIDLSKKEVEIWSRFQKNKHLEDKVRGVVPANVSVVFDNMMKAKKEKKPYTVLTLLDDNVKKHYQSLSKYLSYLPQEKYNKQENFYSFFFTEGALNVVSHQLLGEDECKIMLRFAKVFGQMYTRFLDLQKAEAQARESQIQLALERVRARTMAMQKSDELPDAANILFQQVQTLGIPAWSAGYCIWDDDKQAITLWMSSAGIIQKPFRAPVTEDPSFIHFYDEWKRGETFYVEEIGGNAIVKHYQYMLQLPVVGEMLKQFIADGGSLPTFQIFHLAFFSQGFLLFITYEPVPEAHDIFKRFAKVFEQTYTRFLDLQKAEAQARESQTQLALERVRARTMAMQRSDELKDAAIVLFQQIKSLGVETGSCGFNIWDKDENSATAWMSSAEGELQEPFKLVHIESEIYKDVYEAAQSRKDFLVKEVSGEALKKHFDYLLTVPGIGRVIKKLRNTNYSFPERMIYHFAFFNQGYLSFHLHESSPETHDIFKRFANVFEQTYTRFLDLQKAEAQAREARIETALERVRSRTMGMQHSGELKEAALLLFQQVQSFGVDQWACGYNIWEEDGKTCTAWMARQGALQPPFKTHPSVHHSFQRFYEAKGRGENFYVEEIGGDEIKEHYKQLVSLPEFKSAPKEFFDEFIAPEFQIFHIVYFAQGYLMFITYKPVPEMWDIFKRFGKVFEQTYTRFIDLQKAEAQAREAQIEAALERVRASAMAMHTSEDLSQITIILREQIALLGEKELESILIHIYHEKADEFEAWYAYRHPGNQKREIVNGKVALDWSKTARARTDKEKYYGQKNEYTIVADYEMLKEWYEYLFEVVPVVVEVNDDGEILVPDVLYYNYSKISGGALVLITNSEASDQSKNLLNRAAKVFNLAYTRFLDLQKAEAQAREAVRQSSLDRVRGQIASMRSTEDLNRITPLIWHELIALGVPFIRCGVFIIDESNSITHVYLSSPDGHSLAVLNLPFDSSELTKNSVENWRKGLVYHQHWNKEEFINWTKSMMEMGQIQNSETYQGAATPPESLDLHFVPFTQGMLYVGNTNPLAEDEIDLVKSLAEAFSIAYARYEDFTKLEHAKQSIENTLTELKAAQKQLVQSEKMASLGELTTGIAHEIQNPLNFVNNFSEVNKELIAEMRQEISKGNYDEVNEIAKDVEDNSEKINHHGKRAGDIVKGMLQHSQKSTGVKEPTNINALADEYLRLSYHGLRAKDKTFNAEMKTDFDENIGKIDIIPQDIGRVLLNLYNNAFYACTERSRSTVNEQKSKNLISYEPTVSVTTKKSENHVIITVSDNGNGIPQNIVDKIFQPFFTTKPTGQGTGLGLSLSYDIVKAHGGEIRVESKEGEGTEFIIQMPVS